MYQNGLPLEKVQQSDKKITLIKASRGLRVYILQSGLCKYAKIKVMNDF